MLNTYIYRMAVAVVLKKLKSFLLFIVAVLKRALCCFRRRRRLSEFVPLTQIGVVSNQNIESVESENWDEWNEQISIQSTKPASIQEHIEFYRQQAIAARQAQEEHPTVQEHFFDDMAPTITKQAKIYIRDKKEDSNFTDRLSLAPENVNIMGQELGEWEDNRGWEDQTLDWDAREALKETRKQARQKRLWEQQQRKQEKFTRSALGAKVYS